MMELLPTLLGLRVLRLLVALHRIGAVLPSEEMLFGVIF